MFQRLKRRTTIARKKAKSIKRIGKRIVKNPFEYEVYQRLDALFPGCVEYETEKIPYLIQAYYLPDFKVTLRDGRVFYVEAKGAGRAWDSDVRRKMILVKEQHPDKQIFLVFYRDAEFGAKRKNGSRQKQSDWSVKAGYPFAIREFNERFFNEQF